MSDLTQRWKQWSAVRILRQSITASVHGVASGSATSGGSATITASGSKPEAELSVDEQLARLRAKVDDLDKRLKDARSEARAQLKETRKALENQISELSDLVAATDASVQVIKHGVVGRDGIGLQRAAVGLVMVLVGVALTTFGLAW